MCLTDEYEKLLNALHKTKDELYEVNKQLSTLQNNETSARFNEQRYKQEYEILKKQNDWQNEQLKKKNEEFLQYKDQRVSYLRLFVIFIIIFINER